jgi:predicted DNA-binding WGR domain protein
MAWDEGPGSEAFMTLLHRICAEQNMARFYALSLERTLFGEHVVIRLWGRIGRRGQSKSEHFDAADDAERRLQKLAAKKRRRGYVDAAPLAVCTRMDELGIQPDQGQFALIAVLELASETRHPSKP